MENVKELIDVFSWLKLKGYLRSNVYAKELADKYLSINSSQIDVETLGSNEEQETFCSLCGSKNKKYVGECCSNNKCGKSWA